jgi:hypothetical protein
MKRSLFIGLCAALVLTAAGGCTAKKPVVFGLVTLDGKPVENGSIQFFPVAGDGQTSAAMIAPDGRYRLEASPTTMKVVISASKVVGHRKMYDNVPDSPTVEVLDEVLPARYSDMNKSELRLTVVPGENEANFELHSDKKK